MSKIGAGTLKLPYKLGGPVPRNDSCSREASSFVLVMSCRARNPENVSEREGVLVE